MGTYRGLGGCEGFHQWVGVYEVCFLVFMLKLLWGWFLRGNLSRFRVTQGFHKGLHCAKRSEDPDPEPKTRKALDT